MTSTFQPGEKVFVAHGSYQGTIGCFVQLRPDASWADVFEDRRGLIRTHPVSTLRHLPEGKLVWSELLGPND